MSNRRDKLVQKLKDSLDPDHTLQGDLGFKEIAEAMLIILEETAPKDTVIPHASQVSSGSRERKGNPEFEANKEAVKEQREVNEETAKDFDAEVGETDHTDNADSSLGRMNETDPETLELHSDGDQVQDEEKGTSDKASRADHTHDVPNPFKGGPFDPDVKKESKLEPDVKKGKK